MYSFRKAGYQRTLVSSLTHDRSYSTPILSTDSDPIAKMGKANKFPPGASASRNAGDDKRAVYLLIGSDDWTDTMGQYKRYCDSQREKNAGLYPRTKAAHCPCYVWANGGRQVDQAASRGKEPSLRVHPRTMANFYSSGARQAINPFAVLVSNPGEIEAAINIVLNVPGITWKASQHNVIKSLSRFPDRFLIVQGFPGTGKTLTLIPVACHMHFPQLSPSEELSEDLIGKTKYADPTVVTDLNCLFGKNHEAARAY
ncbi:uncharacterized protein KD926_005158, partial [Aspergillus affinis]|uniref:uncharacterized protein n=1 Tax=Aspergillus affinis TaxID=1070780 RepID=UPI0022FF3180